LPSAHLSGAPIFEITLPGQLLLNLETAACRDLERRTDTCLLISSCVA
jgi:hypothetical protein